MTFVEALVRPFAQRVSLPSSRAAALPGGDEALLEWGGPGTFSDKKEVFGDVEYGLSGASQDSPPTPKTVYVSMDHSPLFTTPSGWVDFLLFEIPPVTDSEKTVRRDGSGSLDTSREDPDEGIEHMMFELTLDPKHNVPPTFETGGGE